MEQYCAIIKCVKNFSPKKGKVYFMKVKQWLASSLAVLMLVSTVGCGDNSSSSKAESKSNNSSAVVSETAMPEKDYATTTDGSAKSQDRRNKIHGGRQGTLVQWSERSMG